MAGRIQQHVPPLATRLVNLHLGDYQYEYAPDAYTIPGGNPRDRARPETVTLANYRQGHAQYKTDPDLRATHAVAPWLVVWDDHEIENNWADETPEQPDPGFLARRAAAYQWCRATGCVFEADCRGQ